MLKSSSQLSRSSDEDIIVEVTDSTIVVVPTQPNIQVPTVITQQLQSISFANQQSLDSFGNETSSILSNLSNDMSSEAKLKDMGEVGDKINSLLKTAKQLDPSVLLAKPGFFAKLFGRIKDPIETFANNQLSVSASVKKIGDKLLEDRATLLSDNKKLEKTYESNILALNELEVYLHAGKVRLSELKNELQNLKQLASTNSNLNNEQAMIVQTGQGFIDRFEQRLSRLDSSRAIVMRQLPQIRIMQASNYREAETIQDCVNTAIPIWEQQISLYITQLRTKLALDNERNVTNMINDTIRTSSALTLQNTIEIANASNNQLVELNTIQTVQDNLLKSIEVMANAAEVGRTKRIESFNAISAMDTQLKTQLIK